MARDLASHLPARLPEARRKRAAHVELTVGNA